MRTLFHIIIYAALLLSVTACIERRSTPLTVRTISNDDSLKQIISQRDEQINGMMATMNAIQDGFNEITEAENRVNIIQDGERSDKAEQITSNIKFIADRMQMNKELIKKLQKQLRESDFKSVELQRVITNMLRQLDEKDQQLQQLRTELDAKDIHIAELDKTISDLNSNVSELEDESNEKTETINSQDAQLNTAWYVFGTKRELKEQRIMDDGKVLQSSFNKNYFTKIDIRVTKEIKLYSKSAKLLTAHPSSSYELRQDNNKQYILEITNPQMFWSTSKYLVILVK